MATHSAIEWTEATWNPVTGCSKISPGCAHCYAERMAKRLRAMGQRNYVNGFEVTIHEHMLGLPFRWKRPHRIFVNSMSDLFHEAVPLAFIVGGESGPGARPIHPDWVIEIRDRCLQAEVPFFFKQWGGVLKGRTGRTLEGRTWNDMPANGAVGFGVSACC